MMLAVACTAAGPSGSWTSSGATPGPSTSTAAPSPAAILATALDPLRDSSTFRTTVEVDGAVIVQASGRSVDGASDVSVTTSGQTVQYVEIPPKAWARHAQGAWVLVAADQAPAAPLDVLARPLTLDAISRNAFRATYPAAALGLEGDPLVVTVTIAAGSVEFRYEATADGHLTSSTTTVAPAPADPIEAPST